MFIDSTTRDPADQSRAELPIAMDLGWKTNIFHPFRALFDPTEGLSNLLAANVVGQPK